MKEARKSKRSEDMEAQPRRGGMGIAVRLLRLCCTSQEYKLLMETREVV